MKCLVTGAAGFIGNALTKRLVEEDHQVKAIIHTGKPKLSGDRVEYIIADITDASSLENIVCDCDVVFHCAALVKDFGPKNMFNKVNVEGTKNIVDICKNTKCFIYLGHIRYESDNQSGYYFRSKYRAEQYLLDKYKQENFPVVIIRPGNVYGPGATTWVLRPLHAIQKNQISLIENGSGIFHHTYIDNLIDVLLTVMKKPKAIGESFDITDGDHFVTWSRYLNDLAEIAGKKPINKSMSKTTASILSRLMMILYKFTRITPLLTPTVVQIFTNKTEISIEKAEKILEYAPKIDYKEGMKQITRWLQEENLV